MMRADAVNSHAYPVMTKMTATKNIPVSLVCSTKESKLKGFLVNKNLSRVGSTDKDK